MNKSNARVELQIKHIFKRIPVLQTPQFVHICKHMTKFY